MRRGSLCAWATSVLSFFSASVYSQSPVDNLSFGHQHSFAPDGRNIAGWNIGSEGHPLQILSDRLVLTPPAPGHTRGGIWAEHALNYQDWTVDVDFRVAGPERASGVLQLWLATDTSPAAGLRSIYTVEAFDGLALVLDQYSGSAGSVRGFLNDGSVNYKNHHNVDTLAFGHCEKSFRNLGRMSRLRLKHDSGGLEVLMDDKLCFKSNMIKIPQGYYFGMSAAAAEIPDSFEVSKFVVSSGTPVSADSASRGGYQPPPPPPPPQYQASAPGGGLSDFHFNDLSNRVQAVYQGVENVGRELGALGNLQMERHNEVKRSMPSLPQSQIDAMDRRIQAIEQAVQKMQRDIEGRDYQQSLTNLQNTLKDTQANLMSTLPQSMSQIVSTSAPKMGFFIFVIIAFQALLAGLYVLYKRQRLNSPKKLL